MTITDCPHCKRRLPRHYHYTLPEDGWELFSGLTMLIAGTGGVVFALAVRRGLSPWPAPDGNGMVAIGAAVYGACLVLEGFFMRWLAGVLSGRPEDEEGEEPAEVAQPAERIVMTRRTRSGATMLVRPEPPEGVSPGRLWVMLGAIDRYDDVTLSESTARDYRAVANRDAYRRLLRWLVDQGLYETARDDAYDNQSGGDITDRCRQLVQPQPPAPAGDEAHAND